MRQLVGFIGNVMVLLALLFGLLMLLGQAGIGWIVGAAVVFGVGCWLSDFDDLPFRR